MDQDQIRTILAVERTGSFTQASEPLHVTQFTGSARVRQLEQELGATIWDRITRRLILNPANGRFRRILSARGVWFGVFAVVWGNLAAVEWLVRPADGGHMAAHHGSFPRTDGLDTGRGH